MRFIVFVVVFTLFFMFWSNFSEKQRIKSAVESAKKIQHCGYFLGIEQDKRTRFTETYLVFLNQQNKKEYFNFYPKFDVHNQLKKSENSFQGQNVCYQYAYSFGYGDQWKVLTKIWLIK